jgi:hypothetical protein
MKKLFVIITLSVIGLFLFLISGFWTFSKDEYINKKVLELSKPFSVKIDIEFLQKLKPANE